MGYLELAKQVVKETVGVQGNQDLGKVKDVALQPIPQETLNGIFEEASERLSTIYKGGEFEHCRIHHPELYQAERDALAQVDKIWIDALAGKITLEAFKMAVEKWYESIVSLIDAENRSK